MKRGRRLSWTVKLPIILVVFAVAPLMLNEYWALDLMRETARETTLGWLAGLATAKAKAIDQFTDDRTTDVERIAQLVAPEMRTVLEAEDQAKEPPPEEEQQTPLPDLQDAEALQPGDPSPSPSPTEEDEEEPAPNDPLAAERQQALEKARAELGRKIGLILWDQKQFEELLVIDRKGRVVSSTFESHEDRTAKELGYYRSGMAATYVQPVFMSPITERLTMVISTPIRDDERQVIGVLAARLNLTRFFGLINDVTGLGETGETVVGKKIDDAVLFMAPTRHDADAALNRSIALGADHAKPIRQAARGQNGQGEVVDYRGLCVYAAWRHVPSLEWGLAVKQDCEEATSAVAQAEQRMLLSAAVLVLLALLASILAAQALVRPLQQLKDATDRISKGDVDINLDIRSGDEIGDLADSFERMIAAIRFFRERSRHPEEDEAVADEPSVAGVEDEDDPE
jgi:HAMP domain-containing protein